ncbi:MAG: Holliday junction resolvase RuvX [Clostridia bacterium]|nr:Holliday junction resolvase RuvX [Clostridia bacterium]
MQERLMGLDYGDVRTGVAVSDLLGITAQGVESIKHTSDKQLLQRLKEIIDEYNVKKIVIGLPLNMNATSGIRVEKTKKFIEKLKQEFELEVETIDERLTTVASHRTMTELGVSKNKKKNIVDMMSAVLILQMYMDRNRN